MATTKTLEAIKYTRPGQLKILNQLLLPEKCVYIDILNTTDAWNAIKEMKVCFCTETVKQLKPPVFLQSLTCQVRGAPAIAIVGCLSLVVELTSAEPFLSQDDLFNFVKTKLDYLVTSRPTAVNMQLSAEACIKFASKLLEEEKVDAAAASAQLVAYIESMLEKDLADNMAIGEHGAKDILSKITEGNIKILTHCNTGSLATSGYGTALGVIRSLQRAGRLEHAFCTETR
jgi:methylthioribose-1-phosphate isomerase